MIRCLALALALGMCWALAGCGGRSRQAGQEPARQVDPVEGCFPLGVEVTDAQLRVALATKLGVNLAETAVEATEPNALVRGQQLVDAVQGELEQRGLPTESRQALRNLVGALVGEGSLALPAELSDDVQAAMQQELDSFANNWMLEERGSLEALLTSSTTWVNAELAAHYGMAPPAPGAWAEVALPPERRGGLMTLGALLARLPSPPNRATHLSEALACFSLPPPPVLESIWDKQPKQTAKSVVEQAYGEDQVSCKSCHRVYIGYAIALDRYDELGRYRETIDGAPIDTSYALAMPMFEPQSAEGYGQDLPFSAPSELGRALSQASGVRACLIKSLNQQLGGSDLTDSELGCILKGLQAKQGNFASVLGILSPRFIATQ